MRNQANSALAGHPIGLYAFSDGQREPYYSFWNMLRDPVDWASEVQADYVRSTYARTHMTGIARSVGLELTVALAEKLSKARRPSEEPHQTLARYVKETAEDHGQQKMIAGTGRKCRLSD